MAARGRARRVRRRGQVWRRCVMMRGREAREGDPCSHAHPSKQVAGWVHLFAVVLPRSTAHKQEKWTHAGSVPGGRSGGANRNSRFLIALHLRDRPFTQPLHRPCASRVGPPAPAVPRSRPESPGPSARPGWPANCEAIRRPGPGHHLGGAMECRSKLGAAAGLHVRAAAPLAAPCRRLTRSAAWAGPKRGLAACPSHTHALNSLPLSGLRWQGRQAPVRPAAAAATGPPSGPPDQDRAAEQAASSEQQLPAWMAASLKVLGSVVVLGLAAMAGPAQPAMARSGRCVCGMARPDAGR